MIQTYLGANCAQGEDMPLDGFGRAKPATAPLGITERHRRRAFVASRERRLLDLDELRRMAFAVAAEREGARAS